MIAHRGASGYRPEHTEAAYRLAIALGAEAIEPDLVATRDGVLVLRHENEISGTTDVASRPEFAHLRRTQEIDGGLLTGWFTEDFTWAELATLRAIERVPKLRPGSATFDGRYGILRLTDLLDLLDEASEARGGALHLVAEIKHATHFASIGLPLDELFAGEIAGRVDPARLIVESFEQTVLGQVRRRGIDGTFVYLVESQGAPADLVARHGRAAASYADHLTDEGLARLAAEVDGVSVDKALLLRRDAHGATTGTTDVVRRAHAAGLAAFTWTLRAENRFLGRNHQRGRDAAAWGDWLAEFRLVLDSGVDGVFADQPDLVFEALREPPPSRV